MNTMPEDTTDVMEIENPSPVILDFTHGGDGHCAVKFQNLQTGSNDVLVNAIGEFDGRVITHAEPGKYVFNISFENGYELTPVDISEEEILSPPISRSGSYAEVIPIRLSDPVQVEIAAKGDEHIAVKLLNARGELVDVLFNEIGPVESATTITSTGEAFVFIDHNADWDISITPL